jgi:hypothetical protein
MLNMTTIKFPVSFDKNGSLTTIADGTDEFYSQILSMAALTEPGTHPYTPTFGVLDPSFRSISRGMFILQASRFVPEIQILEAEGEQNERTGAIALRVKFKKV